MESRWPSSGKKTERDFDRGILQGARGWAESGKRMSDGEAMTAAIAESRAEDALLTEYEGFVQLELRKQAAMAGRRSAEPEPASAPPLPGIGPSPTGSVPYQGGTPSLSGR
jgi:hypothetical protein